MNAIEYMCVGKLLFFSSFFLCDRVSIFNSPTFVFANKANYCSSIFVVSIFFFTVLCVSAVSDSLPSDQAGTDTDPFNGNLEIALRAFSQIEDSKNPFIKFFRDKTKKGIDYFKNYKSFIQDAVTKGTEMEKKIQSISDTLKNYTVKLPAALQSELEEIKKHAAAELKKLKRVEDVKDIDEMHKHYNAKYTEFKRQVKEITELALSALEKYKEGNEKSTTSNIQILQPQKSEALVAQTQSQDNSTTIATKAKNRLIELIKTSVRVFFTIKKDAEAIYKKMKVVLSALSNICDDLKKVEQMEYHLLGAHKDLFNTDVAFLTRSSIAQFAFAIMFGLLF